MGQNSQPQHKNAAAGKNKDIGIWKFEGTKTKNEILEGSWTPQTWSFLIKKTSRWRDPGHLQKQKFICCSFKTNHCQYSIQSCRTPHEGSNISFFTSRSIFVLGLADLAHMNISIYAFWFTIALYQNYLEGQNLTKAPTPTTFISNDHDGHTL